MADMDVRRTVEAIWRCESAHLVAALTRLVGDVGLAEDLAQEAFAAALRQWPHEGVPDNPAAWLATVGRRRAIDLIRREQARSDRYTQIATEAHIAMDDSGATGMVSGPGLVAPLPEPGGDTQDDDTLALVFIACHPVLSRESRAALTLRMVAGLSTEEIARAFLVPPATIGQRISRAKRTLAQARVPFALPPDAELPARLAAVLEVVYLLFTEGYSATSGETWVRRDLAEEAMRLGRRLTAWLPKEPEVHGLVALMELQASRFAARVGPDGEPILLADQDRSRWDRTLIAHGLAALNRAIRLGRPLGAYTLQAAIAAVHARARSFAETDWATIVALYEALAAVAPSPVVELNRAVALLHADGVPAALEVLDAIADDPRMRRYHLYGAVRADVLMRLGRHAEAARVLEQAAELAPTDRERALLRQRAAAAAQQA
jgi:RNA polymerase sigma factor (sigma-70 family)